MQAGAFLVKQASQKQVNMDSLGSRLLPLGFSETDLISLSRIVANSVDSKATSQTAVLPKLQAEQPDIGDDSQAIDEKDDEQYNELQLQRQKDEEELEQMLKMLSAESQSDDEDDDADDEDDDEYAVGATSGRLVEFRVCPYNI